MSQHQHRVLCFSLRQDTVRETPPVHICHAKPRHQMPPHLWIRSHRSDSRVRSNEQHPYDLGAVFRSCAKRKCPRFSPGASQKQSTFLYISGNRQPYFFYPSALSRCADIIRCETQAVIIRISLTAVSRAQLPMSPATLSRSSTIAASL